MSQTSLALIQSACYEANLNNIIPAVLIGATDNSTLQLIHLFNATGRELRQARVWPQLKKSYTIYMQSQRSLYPLPQDFYCALPFTHWDQGNRWQMQGPLPDSTWNYRTYGYVTIENRKAFRIFGPDSNPNDSRGQFQVNPTPSSTQQDIPITFEYISKSWLQPPNWAASTNYAQNAYVNSNGNNYKKTDSGTDTSGTVSPSMAYGTGQDGGVFWTAFTKTAWAGATVYAPGDYVTNGGNLYVCTVGGLSSGGPSGTSINTDITDGTVTWRYKVVQSWAAETAFASGAIILISSQYYRCTTPTVQANATQITSKNQPTWDANAQIDNTITWTFQPQSYEVLVTDNDLCLFDDELMIAGLVWRFLRARGLKYEDRQQEYELMKDSAMGRWNAGMKISMGGGGYMPSGLNPNLPEGGFDL